MMEGMEARDFDILAEAQMSGIWYPKVGDDNERAHRLVERGYLRAARPPSQASGPPSAPIGFELTPEGTAALTQAIR
jgi:hypothetical protein